MSKQSFKYSKLESTTITYNVYEVMKILEQKIREEKKINEKMKFHDYNIEYDENEERKTQISITFINEEEMKETENNHKIEEPVWETHMGLV